jgi:hypothetical protein
MKKVKLILVFIIGAALLAGGLFFILGCGGGLISVTLNYYGGSDPEGDLITVIIDQTNTKVKHINHTQGETEASQPWYDYSSLSVSDEHAQGFGIIKKVDLGGDGFVLFAEFPQAACVYQKFDSLGDADGNPVYVVYRVQVDKSSYYAKAFNWMRFYIDPNPIDGQSDMSTGFSAFDTSGEQGLLYGAGYSKKLEAEGAAEGGVSDINSGDTTKVSDFTADAATSANILWTGTVGDMATAISMVGTASGAVIMDFGTDTGGGMGLAIPQATMSFSQLAGTYFTLVYEFDQETDEQQISVMKTVIKSDPQSLEVYDFADKTDNPANAVFDQNFTAVGDLVGGPVGGEDISETFQRVSGCSAATSSIVRNAYTCNGAFVAQDLVEEITVVAQFDSTGRFFGFTMFDNETDETDYIVRFGFGIRDTGYTNGY